MAGSPGVWFSPVVKIYVNLREILAEVDRQANLLARETVFCLGKFEDALALEPLASYSETLVSFFANHRYARLFTQTKSASVEGLLDVAHAAKTTLSWTVSPAEIAERYEANAPSVEERLDAMTRCSRRGYPVQANMTPVIPHGNWEESYPALVRALVKRVPLRKLTVGGVRLDTRSLLLLEGTVGKDNAISHHLSRTPLDGDCRSFYEPGLLRHLYRRIVEEARAIRPCVARLETCHKRPHLIIAFDGCDGHEE